MRVSTRPRACLKTFVATLEAEPARVCGFYALTLAELDGRHLPQAWRRRLPRRIPGVRFDRLAVDARHHGKGLGELLLMDALHRAQRIQVEAGGVALFVDAFDAQAAGDYQRFGFQCAPDNPLLLFFPTRVLG